MNRAALPRGGLGGSRRENPSPTQKHRRPVPVRIRGSPRGSGTRSEPPVTAVTGVTACHPRF